ncbi:MFS transporter [Paenibacillaceae bacterium]|nr:MFS transporter [Paenibacillaceae bacterium]
MQINWLIRSQAMFTMAAGMIYPYYLLFLKNLGNSFSKYGLAFAVFTLSSALVSQWLGSRLDRSAKRLLVFGSLGMMVAMTVFPLVSSYVEVLIVQVVMGACSAMQKMSERLLLADNTVSGQRGGAIGAFQFWTSIASGLAVVAGGFLIDWLTINTLFYTSALLYGVSALIVWRTQLNTQSGSSGGS